MFPEGWNWVRFKCTACGASTGVDNSFVTIPAEPHKANCKRVEAVRLLKAWHPRWSYGTNQLYVTCLDQSLNVLIAPLIQGAL